MRKKKKKLVEKYMILRAVSENHGPAASQCLSGGLCGRQGLPYSH